MKTQPAPTFRPSRLGAMFCRTRTAIGRLILLGAILVLGLPSTAFGAWQHTVLKHLGGPDGSGVEPWSGLVIGPDGRLYGTTRVGGTDDRGTVFAVRVDGAGFMTLHSFSGADGANPYASLLVGADGWMYGTTHRGGEFDCGTIFALRVAGTDFRVLHSFYGGDGANPYAGLTRGPDGRLYGTTYGGGFSGAGTVFAIAPDGSDFRVIHPFTATGPVHPYAGVVIGGDGRLYGVAVTAYNGDVANRVSVFALNPDDTGFTSTLIDTPSDSIHPYPGIQMGTDDRLYVRFSSTGCQGFQCPDGSCVSGPGECFWDGGSTQPYGSFASFPYDQRDPTMVAADSFAINRDATPFARFSSTERFSFLCPDNSHRGRSHRTSSRPYARLGAHVEKASHVRELYSTSSDARVGYIFAVATDGTGLTKLLTFSPDEAFFPVPALMEGADGRFYGANTNGGGVIFSINRDGTGLATLHVFAGTDGIFPCATLTEGSDGALYGTTAFGGTYGAGTLFRLADLASQPVNHPPVVANSIPDQTGTYGSAFTFTFAADTFADPDEGDSLTYDASGLPAGIAFDVATRTFAGTPTSVGIFTVTVTATDSGVPSLQVADQFNLTVNPVALAVTISAPASGYLQPVNQNIAFGGSFMPTGYAGAYAAKWTFTNGTLASSIESAGAVVGTDVSLTKAFSVPGVYAVTLEVTDPVGTSASANVIGGDPDANAFVVVYDPNGGFVTGGGCIWSPPGAYTVDPTQEGRANFGFVAKYKKGATVPEGNTEFQFKAGGLSFASSSYQWLVVAGSDAKFKGAGVLNGLPGFGFTLTARDGGTQNGTGADKFRIKIWNLETEEVIYDNQIGTGDDAALGASTVLMGGNITVHTK